MIKLTKHERETLKLLIKDASFSDTEIANRLNITKQAVGFIKRRLENKKVITGYSVNLDLRKLGFKVFCFLNLKVKQKGLILLKDKEATKKLLKNSNAVSFFTTSGGDIGAILIYAFKNLEDLEDYVRQVQINFIDYLEVKEINIFSYEGIIVNSPNSLLIKNLDNYEKEEKMNPKQPPKKLDKEKQLIGL